MKKRLRILKLRLLMRAGFKLTREERSELAFWLTRNVKESASETLMKIRDE